MKQFKALRVSFRGRLAGESETFYPVNFAYSLCRLGLSKNERILRPEILLAAGRFGEKREYGAPAWRFGAPDRRFGAPARRSPYQIPPVAAGLLAIAAAGLQTENSPPLYTGGIFII